MNEDNELLWGAEAIAIAIGRSRRQAFHLLSNGHLPAKKIGGQWFARRSRLLRSLEADGGAEEKNMRAGDLDLAIEQVERQERPDAD